MKNKNGAVISEEIVVLGKTVKKSVLPEIYRLASANKAALEENIKGMMAAQGFTNAGSAMAQLESDLES
ncbi:MAG: hypothetical protein NTX59_07600 [Elusimicrobia bacterium]|nr:hypothetical protein [Elusimicrobiota bacterium]